MPEYANKSFEELRWEDYQVIPCKLHPSLYTALSRIFAAPCLQDVDPEYASCKIVSMTGDLAATLAAAAVC